MRICVKVLVLGFVIVCLAAVFGYAQQNSDTKDTSLGDIARQLKAQKAKQPKPVIVVTNDNIPGDKDEAPGITSKGNTPTDSSPQTPGGTSQGHDEKYFRDKLSKLQDQLDTHKRELDVLQQKLGQNQMQYYNDPNKSLLQQYSRDDINKFTADIDAKKQQVADDQKSIDDLHEELRRDGGDPAWLR